MPASSQYMAYRLRRVLRLAWNYREQLLLSVLTVVAIRILLTIWRYRRISDHIHLRPKHTLSAHTSKSDVDAIVWAWCVRQAARIVPRATCLTQALALQFCLAHNGLQSIVRIGVADSPGGRFEAHAWLLMDGLVLIGDKSEDIARFTPITDLHPKSK